MKLNSLTDLFVAELHDLLSAERQLVQILPKIIRSVSHSELREALNSHLKESTVHEQRLLDCFEKLNLPSAQGRSHGMIGLISAWMEVQEAPAHPDVRDAATIAAVQHMEHYEIAGYGCAHAYAEALDHHDVATLLRLTLLEEEECDRHLTHLAETLVNADAELHAR
jgi:ferritin-like metal-binding protein YciE